MTLIPGMGAGMLMGGARQESVVLVTGTTGYHTISIPSWAMEFDAYAVGGGQGGDNGQLEWGQDGGDGGWCFWKRVTGDGPGTIGTTLTVYVGAGGARNLVDGGNSTVRLGDAQTGTIILQALGGGVEYSLSVAIGDWGNIGGSGGSGSPVSPYTGGGGGAAATELSNGHDATGSYGTVNATATATNKLRNPADGTPLPGGGMAAYGGGGRGGSGQVSPYYGYAGLEGFVLIIFRAWEETTPMPTGNYEGGGQPPAG
jgi:hypothetical protein